MNVPRVTIDEQLHWSDRINSSRSDINECIQGLVLMTSHIGVIG